jgi:hypothetical protein
MCDGHQVENPKSQLLGKLQTFRSLSFFCKRKRPSIFETVTFSPGSMNIVFLFPVQNQRIRHSLWSREKISSGILATFCGFFVFVGSSSD